MKINDVVRLTSANVGRCVTFGKKPVGNYERNDLSDTIKKSMDYLGVQNLAMIIQAPSMPRGAVEQNVGSPYGQKDFIEHSKMYGIDAIQQGPMGKLNRGNNHSPYSGSNFAKEPMFLNLSMLQDKEFAGILTQDDLIPYESKIKNDSLSDYVMADYEAAKEVSDTLLNKAYDNFEEKLFEGDKDALRLSEEFEGFKQQEAYWLDKYAVVDTIAEKNGTDYTPNWPKEDRTFLSRYKRGENSAVERYQRIEEEKADEIDRYKFFQFLTDKQSVLDKENRGDFAVFGDLQVGSSDLDQYIFEDVFLPDWKIGCEWGGGSDGKHQQLWGSPLADPNRLFNWDGSLGPSGQFIKDKLKKAISSSQNLRVDHVMGLVNPYVYKADEVQYESVRQPDGSYMNFPRRGSFRADYICNTGIDPNGNFKRILPDIVIPTMQEMGVNPNDVVWEDLGNDPTGEFWKIFKDQLHLKGIAALRWADPSKMDSQKTAYYASHDDEPTLVMIHKQKAKNKLEPHWKAEHLSENLRKDSYKAREREELRRQIEADDIKRLHAMYAMLFKEGKKIQLPFMDFFGIDKPYNVPGTTGDSNWSLGLGTNWEDVYYRNLTSQGNRAALNIPEILKMAVQAKVDEDVSVKYKPYHETMAEATPILNKLDYWEKYLKEPENN